MIEQQIYIFEGPDRCGKTEMSKELARRLEIPYFKIDNEKKNWSAGTFQNSLWFDYNLPQFLRATRASFVSDRGYPSEWVYSKVFNRNTNEYMLEEIDWQFAKLGATIIVPYRLDYSKCVDDIENINGRFEEIHRTYMDFVDWTECRTILINVDAYDDDLDREMNVLQPQVKCSFKR